MFLFSLQDPYEHTGDANPVLLAVIMSSILKKMSEEQKQYCQKGHKNKVKFLKQFHNIASKVLLLDVIHFRFINLRLFNQMINPISRIMLMVNWYIPEKKEDMDDDDADVSLNTIPIDVKFDISHSIFYHQKEILCTNRGIVTRQQDNKLFCWIPKSQERFQLLHHVAISKQVKGLILFGDEHNIMFGIFVKYKQETIPIDVTKQHYEG